MNAGTFEGQSGVTLIELMIGLTVSMVVVLGMLSVFKTATLATATAGTDATTDRQRLAGLFGAQKMLQGAGFGIDAASFGKDLVVLSGATLADGSLTGTPVAKPPASGNAIVWGSKVSGTYKCYGLYAPTNPTKTTGALIRLPEADCTDAAAFADIAWSSPPILVEDTRAVQINLQGDSSECQVFGITGQGSLWAVLTTKNSVEGSNADVSTSTCLVGFGGA